MAYTEQLPTDSAAKKFIAPLVNNGGSNEFQAVAGTNRRTQNAEIVCDESVDVTTTSGAGATIGTTADAKVDTDAAGTLSSKLRGLVSLFVTFLTRLPTSLGQKAMAASLAVTVASDQSEVATKVATGSNVVEGAVADAAIITDTTGTLSGKLRGLVKWAFERMPTSLGQKAMAASLPVVIASDQSPISVAVTGSPGSEAYVQIADGKDVVEGSFADAAVITDANGTVSSKLRGLIVLFVNFLSRIPASLGQKAMTASLPVVFASDQTALPVSGNFSIGTMNIALESKYRATPSGTTHSRLTVDGTVRQLGSLNSNATNVLLTIEEYPLMATFDGTSPSSTNGHLLEPGATILLTSSQAASAKFLRISSNSYIYYTELTVMPGSRMTFNVTTPEIDTVAYATGDVIGTLNSFPLDTIIDYPAVVIREIVLADANKNNADIDILFFWSNPASSTIIDNAALNIVKADMNKVVAVVHVVGADYADMGSTSVAAKISEVYLDAYAAAGYTSTLFFVLVSRDTMTYSSSDNLTVQIHLERLDR